MQKILKYLLVLTLFILFPLTSSKALTKIVLNETSNGVINVKGHFEEGFVGGIDLVLNLSENVEVMGFDFNTNYGSYTTKSEFNKENHTLTLRVVSGGIGAKHNLLNEKKELSLGSIKLKTTYKESSEYTINLGSMAIIDNNWSSQVLAKDTYEIDGENTFKYLVEDIGNNDDKQDDNDKQDDDKTDQEDEKPSDGKVDNTESNTPSIDEGNSNQQDSDNDTTNDNTDNNVNNSSSDQQNNSTNKKPTTNGSNNNDNSENSNNNENNNGSVNNNTGSNNNGSSNEEKTDNSYSSIIVFIVILAVVVIGCAIYLVIRKRKKLKEEWL